MFKLIFLMLCLMGCNAKRDQEVTVARDTMEPSVVEDQMEGTIAINLASAGRKGKITREFYGTQLSPFTDYPSASQVKPLNLGTIRIGGNLYDTYNWENGMSYLGNGVYKKLQPYAEAIAKVREYGAEPIMQVNLMGQMPMFINGRYRITDANSAESAGQFIRQVNGVLKLKLKHICLGNEFDQWADTHASIWPFSEPLSADEYIDRYIRHAMALRSAQEAVSGNPNDIKLWGPEIANSFADWQSGNMKKDCEWTGTSGVMACSYGNGKFDHFLPYFFDRLKNAESDPRVNPKGYKLLDYASFHYYPTFRSKVSDTDSIIKDEDGYQMVNEMLESTQLFHDPDYVNVHDRGSYLDFAPNLFNRMQDWKNQYYPDAKLVLSEFAVDSLDTTPNYHPIVRPLYMAEIIGIAANSGIENFNRSFLNTYGPKPIPWALLLDDAPTNLYNVYNLFTEHFVGDLVEVEDTFMDKVNCYAATNSEQNTKDVALFIVNKSAIQRTAKISLNDDAKNLSSLNYTIKPWSVSLVRIPKDSSIVDNSKIVEYGAEEMGITIDPHYQ